MMSHSLECDMYVHSGYDERFYQWEMGSTFEKRLLSA